MTLIQPVKLPLGAITITVDCGDDALAQLGGRIVMEEIQRLLTNQQVQARLIEAFNARSEGIKA